MPSKLGETQARAKINCTTVQGVTRHVPSADARVCWSTCAACFSCADRQTKDECQCCFPLLDMLSLPAPLLSLLSLDDIDNRKQMYFTDDSPPRKSDILGSKKVCTLMHSDLAHSVLITDSEPIGLRGPSHLQLHESIQQLWKSDDFPRLCPVWL